MSDKGFDLTDFKGILEKLGMNTQAADAQQPSRKQKKEMVDHLFWKTQPVPSNDEVVVEQGPIETKTLDDVPKEPYELPEGYTWELLDLNAYGDVQELYELLTNNYVEDDDATFRFDYSVEFLRYALCPPGYKKDWHLAIRKDSSKQLVGFISGVPCDLRVRNQPVPSVEINFLCVHKLLRAKRFAPLLIQEITRRVNLFNIWQATYTAGIVLPQPVSVATYWHRSLNPKKLVEIKFSYKPPKMTFAELQKKYQLPKTCDIGGLRALQERDIPQACALLNKYLEDKTHLRQHFTEEEFKHFFLPRKNVIYSYVVTDVDENVTDLLSFYSLPSSVFGYPQYKTLEVAYSFYNVATTVSMTRLMNQALILAKNNKFDVFNALSVMDNASMFKELKFAEGDGNLHYYLYNYKVPSFPDENIGLVLF